MFVVSGSTCPDATEKRTAGDVYGPYHATPEEPMQRDPTNLNYAPDLTDPVELAAQCETLAGGMDQQRDAATVQGGAAGHPFPGHLYAQAGTVFRAAAAKLRELAPQPFVPEMKMADGTIHRGDPSEPYVANRRGPDQVAHPPAVPNHPLSYPRPEGVFCNAANAGDDPSKVPGAMPPFADVPIPPRNPPLGAAPNPGLPEPPPARPAGPMPPPMPETPPVVAEAAAPPGGASGKPGGKRT